MIEKAKKWLKDAATLLFWAVVICLLIGAMCMSALAEMGFRWGPGR